MFTANGSYRELQGNFLFTEIARRTDEYAKNNPGAKLIKVGIGDIVRPIVPSVTAAMHKAVDEMGSVGGYHGYGPEVGYLFLREAICNNYAKSNIKISTDEVFISCGTKCDTSNIQELFSRDCVVAVTDPVYPVYVASNVMAWRGGKFNHEKNEYDSIVYLPCLEENGFVPELPKKKVDAIFLCYPNNPTGLALTRNELKMWVDYANKTGAIILYDGAYEAFVHDSDVPRSIYEIEGAKTCAIEFRSFSKLAGFTGTRLAYTVVPKELIRKDETGGEVSLNAMWTIRQCTKYNGAPYVVQRGAEAVFTEQGMREVMAEEEYYMTNARIMRESLKDAGYTVYGGVNAPYLWLRTPKGMTSWELFDDFLTRLNIIGAPGSGFGASGEGFFRLSAFNSREATLEAMERIKHDRIV